VEIGSQVPSTFCHCTSGAVVGAAVDPPLNPHADPYPAGASVWFWPPVVVIQATVAATQLRTTAAAMVRGERQ
jgi:hypothetical protein